jgi:hypothetical protein
MTAILRGRRAVVRVTNGVWTSDVPAAARLLNAWTRTALPVGYYPDRDRVLALAAAVKFGLEVVELPAPPAFDPDAIY